ncbi:MAG: prepilin-type N-terminal cleavage/methylation domain-containing protein [Oscillibacter sp.]|nr:prepilin-type N-terminal cleavage/methylation domain-containing protein [Oscillibacter sp.]
MKKLNQKGFTLAELLIVVAIIAVLVAIAIPVFNNQLEKSRETTDMANIRAAYAEMMAAAIDDGTRADVTSVVDTDGTIAYSSDAGTYTAVIKPKQIKAGWEAGNQNVAVASLKTTAESTGTPQTANASKEIPSAVSPSQNYQLVLTIATGALVVTAVNAS